uniref:Uncharacterized protein n=1 Tax=uncultured Armatimonadetes bacterium TaxID=157466 RepID=A0A6J4JQ38_9BACT|nr:hypothetical protein AVDCRST_MAG63-3830 [uncultured Armatimonadetes bacterium]
MSADSASSTRPRVRRAPQDGGGHYGTAPRPRASEAHSETDLYLRRSYALIDRLRRAVAERNRPV